MLVVVVLAALVGPSAIARSAGQDLDHFHYLPLVLGAPEPQCPSVRIYDRYGDERDWTWLEATFGPVWIQHGTGAACLIELRDEVGPVSTTVTVLDANGQPKGGVTVVLYYSTAPQLPPQFVGCYDQGDYGQTKWPPDPAAGTIGFWIGGGDYFPPDIGPYVIWVGTPGSDCIHGIGWLAGTNHRHLNPTFMLTGKQ
jgi:hypothetical protein